MSLVEYLEEKLQPVKRTAKAQGRASRQKGQRGEREVATIFRRYGIEAKRGYQARGGFDESDIEHSISGIHIEVKRTETLAIWAALRQSEEEAGFNEFPVVVFRRNGSRWYIAYAMEIWLQGMGYREMGE